MAPGWGGCAARGEHSINWWKTPTEPPPSPTKHVHGARGTRLASGWPLLAKSQKRIGRLAQAAQAPGQSRERLLSPLPQDPGSILRGPWPGVACGLSLAAATHWGSRQCALCSTLASPTGSGSRPCWKAGETQAPGPRDTGCSESPSLQPREAGRYTGDRCPRSWLGPQCWLLLSQL